MSDPKYETYEERRERERCDPNLSADDRGPRNETYEEQLERWRRGWHEEWDKDEIWEGW